MSADAATERGTREWAIKPTLRRDTACGCGLDENGPGGEGDPPGPGPEAGFRKAPGVGSRGRPPLQPRNPRFCAAKFPRFGNTDANWDGDTPNHAAKVAPYWSIEVEGIMAPREPESSGPPKAMLGKLP